MPQITINGKPCEFEKGSSILQVALDNEVEIPHYCWHPGLSVVASCRICLAEVWAPNPRNDNKLEPIPKLLPTCQTPAGDGQVVYTNSPKAIASQKQVMEYLLINHPVDCAVCDQAGECYLQDYAYQYGRGQSRFREEKVKQPKKDLGPHVLLYADRCIMCSRCVRFCREVTGTSEIIVEGRGVHEQIDVFPGIALDNELSANVIDLCPVGALLDKDFLFQQRVWYLTKTPSIDGITASGDNISIEHNKGIVYRIQPRTNMDVNKWWITDEVRYGWKFIHDEQRLNVPQVRGLDHFQPDDAAQAYEAAYSDAVDGLSAAQRIALVVSPMLSCEDAYWLARFVSEFHQADSRATEVRGPGGSNQITLAIGPVPYQGEDKTFPGGFTLYAEKAPNARGVRRVLEAMGIGDILDFETFVKTWGNHSAAEGGRSEESRAGSGSSNTVILTGNYPSAWVTDDLLSATAGSFVVLIDTLPNRMSERADVVIPGATWAEKSGTFESAQNRLQAFERAIRPIDFCKSEAQIALDLMAARKDEFPTRAEVFNPANTRRMMADLHGLTELVTDVHIPQQHLEAESHMPVVEV